jgi:hypothetical protein
VKRTRCTGPLLVRATSVGSAMFLAAGCASSGTTWIGTEIDRGAPADAAPDRANDAAEGAAVCVPAGPGDACTSLPPRTLPALVVQGNQIVQSGRPYHLYAIATSALLWGESNRDGCNGDGHFTDVDLDQLTAWNVNAVRIGLSQARWFGRRCDVATYALRIDHAIAMANAHGLYVILDLHWNDVGGLAPCDANCTPGLQPMPDSESVDFWRGVAARYGDNPGVVFDVFNEPAPGTASQWACWRDGGCTVAANTVSGVTYTAVGMQPLVDAVRSVASRSVVIVTGPDSGQDLSGLAQGYAVSDAEVVYGVHMYDGRGYGMADWAVRFGSSSATYPIMVTEMGSLDCSSNEASALVGYLDAPLADRTVRIGWGIRSWNQPGDCSYPSIIADWNGTPLGAQGQFVRDHFRSYGSSIAPAPAP